MVVLEHGTLHALQQVYAAAAPLSASHDVDTDAVWLAVDPAPADGDADDDVPRRDTALDVLTRLDAVHAANVQLARDCAQLNAQIEALQATPASPPRVRRSSSSARGGASAAYTTAPTPSLPFIASSSSLSLPLSACLNLATFHT